MLYIGFSIVILGFVAKVLFVWYRLMRSDSREYEYNRFLLGGFWNALRGRSNVDLETPDLIRGAVLSADDPSALCRNSTLSDHRVLAVLRDT